MTSPSRLLAILCIGTLTAGCGAKTGLLLDDQEQVQAPSEIAPPLCVDVEPGDEVAHVELDVSTRLLSADLFFLIDCTGSMEGEISNIQRGLAGTIVPGALAQIPDVRFGVGAFSDFPLPGYGAPGDSPFEMRRAITDDLGAVQRAIDLLPLWDGDDLPESQVEALYQVATGEGLGDVVLPAPGCPNRGVGYPCFREGSQPVVMLITDAPFHNGPEGLFPYRRVYPPPHRFEEAINGLRELQIRVIGISSQPESLQPLQEVARRTGAVDGDGEPLVFTISPTGRGLGDQVVRGIETLAKRVPLDVDAVVIDGGGDDVDATVLVEQVVALRAEPASGVERIDGATFFNAMPGTRLTFALDIRVNALPTPLTTQLYPVVVRIRGNKTSILREEIVFIEVPGLDGGDRC